jgi:S1-C subfamily serine protease
MQANGDIVFLAPIGATASAAFVPITFGALPKLGQTVLSLSGTSTLALGQGIASEIVAADPRSDGSDPARIATTIVSRPLLGSPLFDLSGSIVGIATYSLSKKDAISFYPISQLKAVVPVLK